MEIIEFKIKKKGIMYFFELNFQVSFILETPSFFR